MNVLLHQKSAPLVRLHLARSQAEAVLLTLLCRCVTLVVRARQLLHKMGVAYRDLWGSAATGLRLVRWAFQEGVAAMSEQEEAEDAAARDAKRALADAEDAARDCGGGGGGSAEDVRVAGLRAAIDEQAAAMTARHEQTENSLQVWVPVACVVSSYESSSPPLASPPPPLRSH